MALKYASECEHIIIGKPEEDYFMSAINDMGIKKEEVNLKTIILIRFFRSQ